MAVEVNPPQRLGPHKYGLLSSLGTKPIPDRITVDEGIIYIQESCENLDSFDLSVCPVAPIDKPPANRAIRGVSEPVLPHGAYISLSCATVANSQALADERALEVYHRNIQHFIAQQFYLDLLADPNLVPQGTTNASCALALGQDGIASLSGRGSIIFAPTAVVSVWLEGHAVYVKDGRLTTALGNQVVIIPEPPGTLTVFFSDSVPDIYVSEPTVLNSDAAQRLRTVNDYVSVVESIFAITHDPCILSSYDVDLGC